MSVDARKLTRSGLGVFGVIVVLWLVAPTAVILPLSFTDKRSLNFPPTGFTLDWYRTFFTDPDWYEPTLLSVRVGLITAVVATVIGSMAALGMSRTSRKVQAVLGMLFLAPVVVPVIILAIGIYALLISLGLTGSLWGFVAAHTVIAVPYVVLNVYAGLVQFDPVLERAAHSLGANRFITFMTVTLPLIRPSVLAGFLFAFVTSFDEVVLSLFIADPFTTTLPVRLYSGIRQDINPTVIATSSIVLIVTTVLVGIGLFFANRNLRMRPR
jgi:putative spermidine/putrescine transport system permease protein